jgi:hypothetical protein
MGHGRIQKAKGNRMDHTHASKGRISANALLMAGLFTGLSAMAGWAQPTPPPATPDLACKTEAQVNPLDTVASSLDAEGFRSLFNGSFKGWFQSCLTAHSGTNTAQGAIFRVGAVGGTPAIYSTQRVKAGGVLMTNKKFRNYEIRFQIWPDYNNDGGVFNRTPINGRCYRTTLSYNTGGSMGGVWGEGGFTPRDYRPFKFDGAENNILIPGNTQGEMSDWTAITKKIKATTQPNLPCPAAGCTQTDWRALWEMDGWNDFRIQFYGGTGPNARIITMKSWFKKPTSNIWVPLIQDNTLSQIVDDNRIGFLVTGNGRFSGPKGTWYRNIRWRPLDDQGKALAKAAAPSASGAAEREASSPFTVNGHGLSGMSDLDYSIQVMDAKGRIQETFSGKAGAIDHAFATEARGLLFLKVRTSRGAEVHRIVRPF